MAAPRSAAVATAAVHRAASVPMDASGSRRFAAATPGVAASAAEGGPLSGLICLELCSVLAGPTVGQFLAELGVEVVKVENPKTKGDVTRTWRLKEDEAGKPSSYFQSCNLGKKSVALDLVGSEQDRAFLLEDLLPNVDIVLTSYKPGDDKKLGLDYATLLARRPGLIYSSITGYGHVDTRPGYDAVVQAEGGFTFMNGSSEPTKMPVALIDLLAAHQLKEGILLALYEKEAWARSGATSPWPGKLVEVSLLGSAVIALANQASAYLRSSKIPQRIGSDHPSIVPYGTVFYDRDGRPFVLAVGTDSQFRSLYRDVIFAGAGEDEVPAMPEAWTGNVGRCGDRERLKGFLQTDAGEPHAFSHRSREELLDLCAKLKVPAGAVKDMSEVFEHPEVQSVIRNSGGGRFLTQIGWRSDRDDRVPDHALRPPSELAFGHDTQELKERFGR